jgi:hypothetical protein
VDYSTIVLFGVSVVFFQWVIWAIFTLKRSHEIQSRVGNDNIQLAEWSRSIFRSMMMGIQSIEKLINII